MAMIDPSSTSAYPATMGQASHRSTSPAVASTAGQGESFTFPLIMITVTRVAFFTCWFVHLGTCELCTVHI